MTLKSSIYIELAKKKAREKYFKNTQRVYKDVAIAIKLFTQKSTIFDDYNFDVRLHKKYGNTYTSSVSKGCGCKICLTRHSYVTKKLALRRFKKWFYDDETVQSREYYLVKRDSEIQTELEYFNAEVERFEKEIKAERLKYITVRDALNHCLEV